MYEVVISEASRSGSLSVSFPRFRLDGESICRGINDSAHPGSSDRSEIAKKQLMEGFRQPGLDSGDKEMKLIMIDK